MTSTNVADTAKSFVLDTSYIISVSQGQLWALEAFSHIEGDRCQIVIPRGVESEYHRIMEEGRIPYTGLVPFYELCETLGLQNRFSTYRERLRGAFTTRLEEVVGMANVKRQKSLSITDKVIVQAALDIAHSGEEVAVATGDGLIVEEVHQLNDRYNLSIEVFSPWRLPLRDSGIDTLINGTLFSELHNEQQAGFSTPLYIAVLKSQHIGGGAHYDIAFELYRKEETFLPLPSLDSVYFMRLFPLEKNLRKETAILMLSCHNFAVYYTENLTIRLYYNERPFKELERTRLMKAFGTHSINKEHLTYLKLVKNPAEKSWAMIEEADIARHDKVTSGRLQTSRRQLKRLGKK